jgi:hypothetical protein
MWGRGVSLWVMLVGFCAVGRVTGNEHNHQYAIGDMTTLWVNKVGPYNNPQETYNYYTLPFCKTHPEDKVKRKWSGLGEVLEGNEHNHQYAIGDMTTQLLHRPTNRRGGGDSPPPWTRRAPRRASGKRWRWC